MKIYIRAYWYDDEESIDDFIYGLKSKSVQDDDDIGEPEEIITDDYDDVGYSDFDEYDLYDYSEYQDFYKQVKKRQVYVPLGVARDIPDYNAYRKGLFGTLYLSMKCGESIEDLYDELCTDFPGIVNDDAINESDMLLEIVDATLYAQKLLKKGIYL
jgi:hypothetical protein